MRFTDIPNLVAALSSFIDTHELAVQVIPQHIIGVVIPAMSISVMSILKLTPVVLACLFANAVQAQDLSLVFDQPQTVGISGFRAHWNVPFPLSEDGATQFVDPVTRHRSPTAVWSPGRRGGKRGAIAFDALNRFLLVRFPGSATAILN